MKTWMWTGLAGVAAAVCYMIWSKRGKRVNLKQGLRQVRAQVNSAKRNLRKAVAARA